MKKLLYIHGYNGSPEGRSCQLFRKYLPEREWQVIGMDYCQDNCELALRQIRETIQKEGIDLVAGASLGGFLTLLTTGIRRIVINPCYLPSEELPRLGPHIGLPAPDPAMVETFASYEALFKSFSTLERSLVTGFFADNDELFGSRYHKVFTEDIGPFRTVPGGHHTSEEAVVQICAYIRSLG